MKNPWSDRWEFVKNYIPDNTSIIDFGCGNKESLDYVNPTRYLGVDRLSCADLVADLDQNFVLHDKFDLALLLGVLEYVKDPEYTLNNIVGNADNFIVLCLAAKKIKPEWQRVFSQQSIDNLLQKFFAEVTHHAHGRYILSVCKK
jgi:hypothetical protein